MNPVILVGRRADGGRRDRIWDYCIATWLRDLGWPICVGGYLKEGPFCLAVASNRAYDRACADYPDWDVALYVGADVVLDSAGQAHGAVNLALELGQLVFAHDHYYSLSQEGTDEMLRTGRRAHGELAEWPAWPNTFSSCLAVPRSLWEEVGGFDERFVGWGFEDLAFWSACWALGGGFERVTGPVFHLWHERHSGEREQGPHHPANQVLGERYLAARTNKAVMLEILAEKE